MTLLLLFSPMRPWWCRASHKANACLRFNLSIPVARNPRVPKFYLTEWRLQCVPLWPGENFPFHVILVIRAALDDMEMGRKALRTSPYPLPESLHCESFSPWNQPCSWFPYVDVPCSLPLEYSLASPISDGETSLVFKTQLKKPSPHTEMVVCFFVNWSSNILLSIVYLAISNCVFACLFSLLEWAPWGKELQIISFLILSNYQMSFT